MTRQRSSLKHDLYAQERGKWLKSGSWLCDCPAKNPDTRAICRRCDIRRPLRGAPIYVEKPDAVQHGGFMALRQQYVREDEL